MKVAAFAVEEEERPIFLRDAERYGMEITLSPEKPTADQLRAMGQADVLNVLSDTVFTSEMWEICKAAGVGLAVTRTIGVEHMNIPAAERAGIAVRNITYAPSGVADYAIMMMLMVLRNVKPMLQRMAGQDYTAAGLRGRELPELTVGILGAGRIGVTTAQHLSGFGCRVVYWNRTPRGEMDGAAEYLPLERLLAESDVLSIHLSANEETYHFMDEARLAQMKPGAVLINTARGPVVDSDALIAALESGHLSGAGLDVFDGDRSIYYRDYKNRMVSHHAMAILQSMPNVLMLPHMAYLTDRALEDMVHNSMVAAAEFFEDCRGENGAEK